MLNHVYQSIKPLLHPNRSRHLRCAPAGYHLPVRVAAGWYMLEWELQGDAVGSLLAVFTCTPKGSQPCRFLLPCRAGRLVKRVIHLPAPIRGMDISLDAPGQVVPKLFRLVRLRQPFAEQLQLKRLAGHLGVAPALALATLQQQSGEGVPGGRRFNAALSRAYDRTFLPQWADDYAHWLQAKGMDSMADPPTMLSQGWDGDYFLYLAPGYQMGDVARQALVDALRQSPECVLAYPDEDQVDALGRRSNPHFKPDWNPDLFLANDYISACYVCRADWREAHTKAFGALGERAALAVLLPTLPADAILHVPDVLAHRQDGVGAVDGVTAKLRQQAVASLMQRQATVTDGLLPHSLRIRYALPEPAPLVSLLIPTRDALAVLQPCVDSILAKTVYPHYEVLILDNQSQQPETLAWFESIRQHPRVRILPYDHPFNYSAINNFGVRHAKGSIIGLINNDVEVINPDWLVEMVSQVCRQEIGCVGAKLYYSNGQIQHGGVVLGLGHVAGHAHRFLARDADGYQGRLKLVQNYSAVTAACLLVRREVYGQVGGLEEEHLTVAYNDVDFCLRVRAAGYRNLWTPYAELYHHESISRGEDDTPEKKARFDREVAYMRRVWGQELDQDPCYNPNLSRRREDFALREFL